MKPFEILGHPADIGIIAFGKTIEELFRNAVLATSTLFTNLNEINPSTKKEININGNNIEDLLIKLLDEIIFFFDTEGFLIKDCENITISNGSLKAVLMGENFKKEKHGIKLYLKAVTYHQLEVKQIKEGWEAKIYFDV